MNHAKIRKILEKLHQAIPNPVCELNYSTPFELLVAVILSAQSTDVGVNRATAKLFQVANTPEQFIKLGIKQLKTYIKTIGLYNNKAKNILAACKMLIEKFNSQVPTDRDSLQSLPGVGRKTANVILNTAFDQATIGVDTHVFRVANRIGLAKGNAPEEVEQQLEKNIPKEFHKIVGHMLVLHGRYTCKAKKPLCAECQINSLCEFADKSC